MLIKPYEKELRSQVVALSLRAWRPVFAAMRDAVPGFVYDNFYPAGWEKRQTDDVLAVLDGEAGTVDVAVDDRELLGWVCTRLHEEDRMGEVYVLAVDPAHQRRGVASALMAHAAERARRAGMAMMMVETGGDPGHAAARTTYEAAGYEQWPVARYFKDLSPGA
ncbi:GNAT family N-acetyltransferase [Streptomyces sp. NPDC085466]|uniref:GNAT family N-acetyltransferase n=1 Tax=Streptomyces sp. NPDC085466 TaxID=3365725 RepID=UPI0037CDED31